MKKMNSWLLPTCLASALLCLCISCESKTEQSEEQISSDPSKDYLLETGRELLNIFSTSDQEQEIATIEGIVWKFDHYDWDFSAFENYYDEQLDIARCAPRYMLEVVSGKRSPMVTPTYGFSSHSAVFEANESTHKFEYKGAAPDKSFIVRMLSKKGNPCEAKCWGEGAVRTYEYTYDDPTPRTIQVELPEKIYCEIKENDKVIARMEQQIDVVENHHYNLSGTYQAANISWTQAIEATHNNIRANVNMKYGSKPLLTAKINIPSYTLSQRLGETYEEYGERISDNWEDIVNSAGELTADVDIINRVQMRAHVSNIRDFYAAYRDWEETYDATVDDYMSRLASRALVNIYNTYCSSGLYYNSDVKQANLILEPYETDYREGGYYDIEPLIYFESDGTSYAYGQYFSEDRFGSLIDLAENVANKYIDVLQLFDVDKIELR